MCGSLSIFSHCLSLGLERKLIFSSPVATAEFSKFAGILSSALSQHHLSGFEIAQLELHHLRIRASIYKFWKDPDNHDGVITHVEPDILEYEVKWALGSITTNKASGADGIPVELFQILKMMLLKCCTQYVSKFGKLSSGHRTGKGQFSFQSQRRAMPKNVQTIAQLYSFHTQARRDSKSFKPGFNSM